MGTSKNDPSTALPTKPRSSRISIYAPVASLRAPCIWALFRGPQKFKLLEVF